MVSTVKDSKKITIERAEGRSPDKGYSQNYAANEVGVTQKQLSDRDGIGWITKLKTYCFPGEYQSRILATDGNLNDKGITELSDLIQHVSPQPPELNENGKPKRDERGKVIKQVIPQPKRTLEEHGRIVREREQIPHEAFEEYQYQLKSQEKVIEAELLADQNFIEDQLASAGLLVRIEDTEDLSAQIFSNVEKSDTDFWDFFDSELQKAEQQAVFVECAVINKFENTRRNIRNEYFTKVKKSGTKRQKMVN